MSESASGRLLAGRYRLLERIGRGGMGTVWRAEDELLARQVAVKQLHVPPGLTDDELATLHERTRREARSAARISHPNVVVVHDVVEDDGQPCIVMEHVPSTTLGDVLRAGTLSPDETARIGRGMIAALRAAHAAGVLHRDVKPGNVLLGEDGRVVLTDFGIAYSAGSSTLTKTGEMVGSIDYIAPERVKGAKPSPAADLWALGATLYQAVEGQTPFHRDTPVETAYAIAADPLEPPLKAGPLTRLIVTLLTKDPDLRPPAELIEQILREPAATPTTARMKRPGPVPRPEPTPASGTGTEPARAGARARTALWAAAAAVAAAGLAVGAYVLTPDGGPDGDDATPAPRPTGSGAARPGTPAPSRAAPSPPRGYHLVDEERLGVSFPVPDGWTRREKSAVEVRYIDPTGLVGLRVNVLDFAGPDHVRHWKDVEEQLKTKVRGYRRDRLQETTYRGGPAAVWEFSFTGRAREYRAIDLGFGRAGGDEYAIYLSAPSVDWDRHRPVFDAVRDGFRMRDRH